MISFINLVCVFLAFWMISTGHPIVAFLLLGVALS